ncbi:MAG: hypothetical protein U0K52_01770 [Clostridia bacterium]|jgi:hypothetical protein|nr:hypothetical protein [Clostridia bacterium]
MIVTDLSQSFHPVPKESGRKDKRKAESSRIKQKSSKLAKLERNRFSIITKDLEHCYICTKKGMKNIPKDDLHELLEGKNRQVSMKYGLVIPICRKCHNLVTNDKTLQDKLHKVAQKEFKKHYKTENFIQIFGQSYL